MAALKQLSTVVASWCSDRELLVIRMPTYATSRDRWSTYCTSPSSTALEAVVGAFVQQLAQYPIDSLETLAVKKLIRGMYVGGFVVSYFRDER